MEWSYGVTCVPERFDSTLPLTLESLAAAGFPEPRLFVDGAASLPPHLQRYEATFRNPRIRAYGNWMLALWELYVRNPRAERFMLVQDDVIFYRNLRGFLERMAYPERSYLNLFCYPENEKAVRGFYPSPKQEGKGALALVFNRDAVQMLFSSKHMADRPVDPNLGHMRIDGGVVSAASKAGFKEYVHNPTLVQHISESSIVVPGKRCPTARTWRGDDYDALELLKSNEQPTTNAFVPAGRRPSRRIGLVGYCSHSGLGEMNRALAEYVDVDIWLVKPHEGFTDTEVPEVCDMMSCPSGRRLDEFLQLVDVVLFVESPPYDRLLQKCQRRGVRTICIAMQEWMPSACRQWATQVDHFICPTYHSFELFRNNVPCALLPWPADVARFAFTERQRCERFLYLHGRGGVHDAKGGRLIAELVKRWPDIPLTVVDHRSGGAWGNAKVVQRVPDNRELYSLGDVLLVPGSVAGLSQECIEAAAAGMPVISTDAPPWNEYPALDRVRVAERRPRKMARPVDYFTADVADLEDLCHRWLGQDIGLASRGARVWALNRRWESAGPALTNFLRGEIRDQEGLDEACLKAPTQVVCRAS